MSQQSPQGSVFRSFDERALARVFRTLDVRRLSMSELEDVFPAAAERELHKSAESLYRHLRRNRSTTLEVRRRGMAEFEARLTRYWAEPLDRLESLLDFCVEVGGVFIQEHYRAEAGADLVLFVLMHLHARACQVAGEVLVLLKAGYADGAQARWRCLHELSVVGAFISKHGQVVADRFLRYGAIASQKAAEGYQEHARQLGCPALTERELDKLTALADSAMAVIGSRSRQDYVWAARALGKASVNFHDIAEDVGLGHWKPYYTSACYNVHASPKRIGFSLGYSGFDVLPAGPCGAGLAEPGQGTALSLGQLTETLLGLRPTALGAIVVLVLSRLAAQVGRSFVATQKRLERPARPRKRSAKPG